MKEIEKGQQDTQEKIAQMTKLMMNITKGKWITNDPGEPTSWKGDIDPSIVSNSDGLYE